MRDDESEQAIRLIGSRRLIVFSFILILLISATLVYLYNRPRNGTTQRDDVQGSLVSGGLTRTYLVHIPASYDGTKPTPLVLAFNGGGGDGAGMERLTHLSQTSDVYGFIVVYPDGYMKHWADGRGTTPPDKARVDDVAFVSALIKKLAAQYNIDTGRVYATGMSNGGFFTQRLACELSNQIAAVATVAATTPTNIVATCHPGRPVPVILIHGTDDPLVPASGGMVMGGEGGAITSLNATADLWAGIDGCSSTPKVTYAPQIVQDGTQIEIDTYGNCVKGSEVVVYVVVGGGHAWPGGLPYLPQSVIGTTSQNMDASQVIWAFFQNYSLGST